RERFRDHARVVLVHPLDGHRIADADDEVRSSVTHQRGVPEPRLKTVVVDLGLYPPKDIVPDRSWHAITRPTDVSGLSLEGSRRQRRTPRILLEIPCLPLARLLSPSTISLFRN